MTGALLLVSRVSTAAALALACVSCAQGTPPPSNDRQTLRPVSLPDLAKMEQSVQIQMRARYASLLETVKRRDSSHSDLASAYGDMGKLLTAAEYLDAAEPCFINAQTLMPSDPRWPYYLGHLYRLRNELTKSESSFKATLQLRPGDLAALVWLGNVYIEEGRSDDADPQFAKALALDSGTAAAEYGLGRTAVGRQDFRGAIEHLEKALALAPESSAIRYPLAMAYRGLHESAKAEAHLKRRGDVDVLPPDPLMQELSELLQTAAIYANRGDRALETQAWATALGYFRKGVDLAPEDAALRLKLGTALFMTNDADNARLQFREALRLNPGFAKAHYSLGVLAASNGGNEEAIRDYSTAIHFDPSYAEARLALAQTLLQTGRIEESLRQFDQVLKIDSRLVHARLGYAMALVRLQRYQQAREWLFEAIRIHPDKPEFRLALAKLLAAAPDAGVRDGRQAVRITSELLKERRGFDVGEAMAMALAEVGEYEEAVAWQRAALAAAREAGRADFVKSMNENLARYLHHEPCRVP